MSVTNYPNPAWDLDDDNQDQKKEEAEVTANNASFPTTNYQYSYWQRWSRAVYMYVASCACTRWVFDGSSGNIAHSSQISFWAGDTHRFSGNYSFSFYPAVCNPSTGVCPNAALEAVTEPQADAVEVESNATEALVGPLAASVRADGLDTDVVIRAPSDIAAHAAWNGQIARALAGDGSLEAVVTFNKPLAEADFLALSRREQNS